MVKEKRKRGSQGEVEETQTFLITATKWLTDDDLSKGVGVEQVTAWGWNFQRVRGSARDHHIWKRSEYNVDPSNSWQED